MELLYYITRGASEKIGCIRTVVVVVVALKLTLKRWSTSYDTATTAPKIIAFLDR